jgi:hypothetical protein
MATVAIEGDIDRMQRMCRGRNRRNFNDFNEPRSGDRAHVERLNALTIGTLASAR